MKKLYLSASGISDFLSCPAKFNFRQTWKLKIQKDNLGLVVHRALETDTIPEDKDAKKLFKELQQMIKMYGIKIGGREIKERLNINPEIIFTRVFDIVGTMETVPVIVDYKTATRPWESIDGVYPQARSIQAAAYAYPLQQNLDEGKAVDVVFLVASKYGRSQYFKYSGNALDERNLMSSMHLISMANKENEFPYNRTKMCAWCDYSGLCFKSCGWRKLYERRDGKDADFKEESD